MSVQVGNTSVMSIILQSPGTKERTGERRLSIHERLHSEHTDRELRKKELSDAYYNQLGGEKADKEKLKSNRHRSSRSNVSDKASESSQRRIDRRCREE